MSTSCIPTSRNAEFDNFYFTNNKTFPLLTWMRNLKTNSLQSLLRSRLFHYHESFSMLEGNVHLYKTEDSIRSATLTCSTTNMVWRKQKYCFSNAFVKSLASEERHDGNIVPDVLRERAERRTQSRNIYSIFIYFIILGAETRKIDISWYSLHRILWAEKSIFHIFNNTWSIKH